MAVSNGFYIVGASPLVPNTNDRLSAVMGSLKRCFHEPKHPTNHAFLQKASQFTQKWIEENLVPLDPGSDTSLESWLINTDYNEARCDELRKAYIDPSTLLAKVLDPTSKTREVKVQMFTKWEFYNERKHHRMINARHDGFKASVGPIFKLIEKEIFKNKTFIKKVPTAERPQYLIDRLQKAGNYYLETDYSSFESLFTPELINAIEMPMYKYMSRHLPEGPDWYDLIENVLTGTNIIESKHFFAEIPGKRMSGEMNTSLGNGFANFMILKFVMHECGINYKAVVEGDDGLISCDKIPDFTKFEELSLELKFDVFSSIEEASFCGLTFDPSNKCVITDPLSVLCKFGWLNPKYRQASQSKLDTLMRCKALSYGWQYPGCPIVAALSKYALRVTRHIRFEQVLKAINNPALFTTYERETLLTNIKGDEDKINFVEVSPLSRTLMENKYGVPPILQFRLEFLLDHHTTITPIYVPELFDYVPSEWMDFYDDHFSVTNMSVMANNTDL